MEFPFDTTFHPDFCGGQGATSSFLQLLSADIRISLSVSTKSGMLVKGREEIQAIGDSSS